MEDKYEFLKMILSEEAFAIISERRKEEVVGEDFYIPGTNVKEEESLFQKALSYCDFDIVHRYNYLEDLLCDFEDQETELYEDIVEAEIDEEIAQELIDNGIDARNDLIEANRRRYLLKKKLDKVSEIRDVVENKYDEVYFGILQNLE